LSDLCVHIVRCTRPGLPRTRWAPSKVTLIGAQQEHHEQQYVFRDVGGW
jgi:hypothetical protein